MKKYITTLLLAFVSLISYSQEMKDKQGFIYIKDKQYNVGFRIGFNSQLPIIHEFSVNDKTIEDFQQQYKVGYLAAVSLRINFGRTFLNPTVSWYYSESELNFTIPVSPIDGSEDLIYQSYYGNHISTTSSSLDIPILVGYDFVKSNPYRLSFMLGPKFKYFFKNKYDIGIKDSQSAFFMEDNVPYCLNLVAGVDVTIGRLFLDFTYELGLTRINSTFGFETVGSAAPSIISYDRRANSLSFALGVLF